MDPVQSWLDVKEVRRMAESLMAPAPKVDESVADAGYGEDFEGFADAAQTDSADQGQEADRSHTQHQMSYQPDVVGDADRAQRAAVGNALADARRVAEESGMLHQEPPSTVGHPPVEQAVPPVSSFRPQPSQEISPVVPGQSPSPLPYESPFQVSGDQQPGHDDPVARQVSPATGDPSDISSASPEPGPVQGLQGPELTGPIVATGPKDAASSSGVPSQPQTASVFQLGNQPESQSESISSSTSTESAAVNEAARGPFLSRLQQFSVVLRRELDAEAMFLIDHEGQVLLDEVENVKLIQVARTLANASYRASRQTAGVAAVGNLHVKIGARATLEVIPVDSRYGLLILGVIFPEPLGAERVIQVAESLQKTVEPNQQD